MNKNDYIRISNKIQEFIDDDGCTKFNAGDISLAVDVPHNEIKGFVHYLMEQKINTGLPYKKEWTNNQIIYSRIKKKACCGGKSCKRPVVKPKVYTAPLSWDGRTWRICLRSEILKNLNVKPGGLIFVKEDNCYGVDDLIISATQDSNIEYTKRYSGSYKVDKHLNTKIANPFFPNRPASVKVTFDGKDLIVSRH